MTPATTIAPRGTWSQRLAYALKRPSPLPGFPLAFTIALVGLGAMVVLPLSTLFVRASGLSFAEIRDAVMAPRSLAAFELSFGASFVAAAADAVFGFIVAWVLARYDFPGRSIVDALVDLPFALPTAVAGLVLTTLYAKNGWFGQLLAPLGIDVAFTPLGVTLALAFTGLPFVVRAVQPVIEDLDVDVEEAAATLGSTRRQTFLRVILPGLLPPLLTGFTMAFARALGEYGSIVFISGNMPMRTEIVPLLIVTKLEQYDYVGATAIAAVMLVFAFALLLCTNLLHRWTRRRIGATV